MIAPTSLVPLRVLGKLNGFLARDPQRLVLSHSVKLAQNDTALGLSVHLLSIGRFLSKKASTVLNLKKIIQAPINILLVLAFAMGMPRAEKCKHRHGCPGRFVFRDAGRGVGAEQAPGTIGTLLLGEPFQA